MGIPEVHPGDILLKHTPWMPTSWLIRKLTKSRWNHVVWVVSCGECVESNFTGVRSISLSHFHLEDPKRIRILRIKPELLTTEQMEKVLLAIRSSVGRKYDFGLVFKLIWLMIRRIRKKVPAEHFDTKLTCIEVGAQPLFEKFGFKFNDKIPVENLVPKDIDLSDKVIKIGE